MITNAQAVQKSLFKYCAEGVFCIAFGDGKEFTKYYLKEDVPFLDVNDANYWLVEKSVKSDELQTSGGGVSPLPVSTSSTAITADKQGDAQSMNLPNDTKAKQFKSITVSGKLPIDQFTSSFNYFIAPFAMIGNKVEVQVNFKIISPENSLLTESSQQYKSAKEAAKQLGLIFNEDDR